MKEQFRASADDLRKAYDLRKNFHQKAWEETGTAAAIKSLSQAIGDLRATGTDVQLQLIGNASEDAFCLVQTVSGIKDKGVIVPISGILKIGQVEHLFALSVEEDGKAKLNIHVSRFNYSRQAAKNADIRGECFDLLNDPQAIFKFQDHILYVESRNDIIREHDIAESLGFDENRKFLRLDKSKPNHP